MTFFTASLLSTNYNIHNTVGHDDKLCHCFALDGTFDTIKLHDSNLDQVLRQTFLQSDFVAPLAIDLNGDCNVIVNNKSGNWFGPWHFHDGLAVTQKPPAFLGLMRHHGREHQNQEIAGFANGERQIRA